MQGIVVLGSLTLLITVATALGAAWHGWPSYDRDVVRDDRLFVRGLPARASIERFAYLGSTTRDRTLVDLELEVTLGNGRRCIARRRELMPLSAADRLRRGARLPVRVDPVDPARLVVDWGGPSS